jgi:alkylhydroperoxidase family enzyme
MAAMAKPETCSTFDDADRLVLRYAETLTRDNRVDDTLYAQIAARFSREEQIELCATVGLSSMVNRFHATFRTDVDESTQSGVGDVSFCPIGY